MSSNEKMQSKLDMIKSKNTVKQLKVSGCAVELIIERFRKYSNLNELKHDPELYEEIANCVENLFVNVLSKDESKDKHDMIINIIIQLFPELNNEQDRERIVKILNHLNNNNHVAKIAVSNIVKKNVCSWFKKKFL
jgi:hypothetical protein